jgi:hypothetical protein
VTADLTGAPVVYEQVTQYTVSPCPFDAPEAYRWRIAVVWRGRDRWAVTWGYETLNANGEWEIDPGPMADDHSHLPRTRFDLDTALRLAREAAPKLVHGGRTWAEWAAYQASRETPGERQ